MTWEQYLALPDDQRPSALATMSAEDLKAIGERARAIWESLTPERRAELLASTRHDVGAVA